MNRKNLSNCFFLLPLLLVGCTKSMEYGFSVIFGIGIVVFLVFMVLISLGNIREKSKDNSESYVGLVISIIILFAIFKGCAS